MSDYYENTEVNFAILSHKHAKGLLLEGEQIVPEWEINSTSNTVTIEFDDEVVDRILTLNESRE